MNTLHIRAARTGAALATVMAAAAPALGAAAPLRRSLVRLVQSAARSTEPIQSEQASKTVGPAPSIAGVLAAFVVGTAAWQWRLTRKPATER